MRRLVVLATALTALSVLASVACSSGNNGQNAPTSTSATTQSAPTQPAGTVVATPTALVSIVTSELPGAGAFGRDPIDKPGTAAGNAQLTTAQSGPFDDYDRMTFQFDNSLPSYQVQYVTAASQCGSGQPPQLQGAALLQVRFSPAIAHDDAGSSTVTSTDVTPALPSLLEAKQICDIEGVVTWVLGLAAEVDYRVFAIGSILVVDVKHP